LHFRPHFCVHQPAKGKLLFQKNALTKEKIAALDIADIKNGPTNEGRFLLLNLNNKNRWMDEIYHPI
jgi:hypothetical protein